jgi:hypothetical protein
LDTNTDNSHSECEFGGAYPEDEKRRSKRNMEKKVSSLPSKTLLTNTAESDSEIAHTPARVQPVPLHRVLKMTRKRTKQCNIQFETDTTCCNPPKKWVSKI